MASDPNPPVLESSPSVTHATKQRLLDVGLTLLLQRGYNGLGIQALLAAANTPKGSFYHHFEDKEDFALQVIDQYMQGVHGGLDACLADVDSAPVDRVRHFFEATEASYQDEGYLGCLLGGLGQELSGSNEVFRVKIESCFSYIADRIASCLDEARDAGDLPADADTTAMAILLVDCWEGAALHSRLRRSPAPLSLMLDFYFQSAVPRMA